MTKKEIKSKFEGKKAKAFCLKNQNEEKICLKDFQKGGEFGGKEGKKVLLYFYPKDLTSGCTIESVSFTKMKKNFQNQNTVILGISKDSIELHKKFIKKEKLKNDLLSDEEHKVLEKYGVWQEKSMFGKKYMGVSRESFLIDENGKVLKHFQTVKPKTHAQEVLDFLKALKKK
ncbi:thioredoxin-dependent thiol peroxidase [Candidatus Campbellbacteria bacterium]|nr:MAG: thioredoxin-dependent thiol peroxidase [Candidatus Campbellbacteria bacterium]